MTESYIQNLFADRIGGKQYGKSTAIYKFEKIKRAKRAALTANPGAEIIDMGVGEPDEMAFREVVAELHKEASKPENRGYSDNGDAGILRESGRFCPAAPRCRGSRRRLRCPCFRRKAAQLPVDPRRKGSRNRTAFDQQNFQHDWLALRLRCWQRTARQSLRRRKG